MKMKLSDLSLLDQTPVGYRDAEVQNPLMNRLGGERVRTDVGKWRGAIFRMKDTEMRPSSYWRTRNPAMGISR